MYEPDERSPDGETVHRVHVRACLLFGYGLRRFGRYPIMGIECGAEDVGGLHLGYCLVRYWRTVIDVPLDERKSLQLHVIPVLMIYLTANRSSIPYRVGLQEHLGEAGRERGLMVPSAGTRRSSRFQKQCQQIKRTYARPRLPRAQPSS